MQREKEPQIKVCYTAGGYGVIGEVFEQVENHRFAMWSADGAIMLKENESLGENGNWMPLDKTPWKLCKHPLEYDKEELWTDIWQFIYDHLFLPDKALYDVLTAWVIATWTPEVWTVVPYVFFFGAVASGKTRGLEVLHRLAYRGIISSNISSAALYRACEAWHPTLILDETEIYSKTEKYEIVGLLNSGYRKGQYAIRVKNTEHGCELEVFNVFGFKALAGTEAHKKTLESRSIVVRMMKNRRKVKLHIDEAKADELRGKLLMYRMKTLRFTHDKTNLENTPEQDLDGLRETWLKDIPAINVESGRLQELFQPLLAVSNSGRESIAGYAEKMEQIQLFEEKASEEAEIIGILLNASTSMEEGIVLTNTVKEEFNKPRSEKEKWKSSSVGRLMKRLGFEKRHTKSGNGWYIDKDRLKYMKEIYFGGDTPLVKNGSLGSLGSPCNGDSHTVNGERSERCEPFLAEGVPDNVTAFCVVCHVEYPVNQMSRKVGKPTCRRCAGELIEE